MALRLAIDFGTATTCVATIRNLMTMEPEIIPIEGNAPFCNSVVWIDEPGELPALIESRGKYARSPLDVCSGAEERFKEYWKKRVHAQGDSLRRHYWELEGREKAMLLSYFKPELSDNPEPVFTMVPGAVDVVYDPGSQSSDLTITFERREIASPAPDTDDMVAATAALLRRSAEMATRRFQERIERLVISMPSFQSAEDPESQSAVMRRRAAVDLARIPEDFGSHDFTVSVLGEAEAAGYGLNIAGAEPPFLSVIIDVGAGTTDMALVEYSKDETGRTRPRPPLAHESIRFAGRDINGAVAAALSTDRAMKMAYDAMDPRAWQILLERDIENIKRSLRDTPADFNIPVYQYAAWSDGAEVEDAKRKALYRTIPLFGVSLQDPFMKSAIQRACREWREAVGLFLLHAAEVAVARNLPVFSVELVGGAFRFAPLALIVKSAALAAGLDPATVKYRDTGDESQTVVARGLARWVALQP